ncbi:ABC transporter G family member 2, putative [Plasmodium chabaudi chabaudi]|uniref:ABC transporter G family member 2, putative n=1 Tax=Plasmodium chabaudi chabaudi TaxID=31271 RepID=A0A077YFZ2_PLACU|nr:ABC transporter G family member 2, putative [Plasmodium chabaudi chabaudi]SCM02316.1 ABC transporter G family member 2, putative [Plasmodium chabaudi chabaudi]SCM04511.1 ABC transporter G family member 2, putative [Plasmodium chabaudi chabaudi]VTZ66525.1 ABC transporter G family member 2, putative [Plasmodium chabaudi chabaudi]|eukprot:XP_745935.2 ATP-binding cassette sub-family G member 2, putative [Plasmodium chabaudi chabaudi]
MSMKEENKKELASCYKQIAYKFSNVKYSVDNGNLEILHGINGMILPQKITIVMGPSGSGKTTLLNILSMQVTDGVEGEFLINGQPRKKSLKHHLGYVLQDDYFFANLTVYQTLEFAARIKLDIKDKKQLNELVNSVLNIMDLSHVKDTVVGNAFIRGISGGQRKRLSIATELISNPPLLLMDEPTSGLDSAAALSLVECMQKMSRFSNTTILSSLHQPSSQIFEKFDKLIAINGGYIIYQGKPTDLNTYLKKIGFICPYGWNVADYLMEILSVKKYESILLENYNKYILFDEKEGHYMDLDSIDNTLIHDDRDNEERQKEKSENNSNMNNQALLPNNISQQNLDYEMKIRDKDSNKIKSIELFISFDMKKASYFIQYRHLLIRGLKKFAVDELSIVKIIDFSITLTVFGFLWTKAFSDPYRVLDSMGAIFFMISYWTYYSAYLTLYSFPSERVIIAKERNVKTYQVSSYFLSYSLAEFIFFFGLIAVWSLFSHIALHGSFKFGVYIGFVFVITLNSIISSSLGYFISTLFNNLSRAVSLVSVSLLTMTLTNGFYVEISKLDHPVKYLQWFSFQTYTASALAHIKFSDLFIECLPNDMSIECQNINKIPENMIIKQRFADLHIFISILALLAFYFTIKTMTYISLRWSNALKMK